MFKCIFKCQKIALRAVFAFFDFCNYLKINKIEMFVDVWLRRIYLLMYGSVE